MRSVRVKIGVYLALSGAVWLTAAMAAEPADGEKAYMRNACIECHGTAGHSPDPDMFPKLAGLGREYIVEQLQAFRSGSRQNPIMQPVAATLTDDDIAAIAAYLAPEQK
jgi:cytochrome c553